MKTVREHIEHIKGKPHHVRKRVAFAAAATGAAGVALVWLVSNLSLGTFAIKESSFADSAGLSPLKTTGETADRDNGLAGAAAALPAGRQDPVPAHIEIVDTVSSTSAPRRAEQTIIPF